MNTNLNDFETKAGDSRVWQWIIGVSLVLIAYFTLFPFDFFFGNAPSFGEVIRNFDMNITMRYAIADFPRNLVLFVPFGFGLAGMTAEKWGRRIWVYGLVVLAGFGLSLMVETLQTYTLQRFPALGDVLANGSGTAVGLILFLLFRNQILGAFWKTADFIRRYFTLRRAFIVYLLYVGFWIFVSFQIQHETRLSNWDDGYFLMIGNEATGDRQWLGAIRQFQLFDRALSEKGVAELFEGGLAIGDNEDGVVGYYDFVGDGAKNFPMVGTSTSSVTDSTSSVTASTSSATASAGSATGSAGSTDTSTGPVGAVFSDGRWLMSEAPVAGISRALGESSAFTAVLVAKSDSLMQEGPARLVSISQDAFIRNLTLGQENQDLVVRVRTPLTGLNGRLPEFVFPEVFNNEDFKKIVVTYNGAQVGLYVDGTAEKTVVNLLPSIAILTKYFPNEVDRLRIYWGNLLVFRLLFSGLVFLPLAFLIEYWQNSWMADRWKSMVWVTAVFLGAAVLWQVALSTGIDGYTIRAGNVGLDLVVLVGGYLVAIRQRQN